MKSSFALSIGANTTKDNDAEPTLLRFSRRYRTAGEPKLSCAGSIFYLLSFQFLNWQSLCAPINILKR